MGVIGVLTRAGERFLFNEQDIRQVCRIMRCGDSFKECIELFKRNKMECALCYAMLKVYNKPFKQIRHRAKLHVVR